MNDPNMHPPEPSKVEFLLRECEEYAHTIQVKDQEVENLKARVEELTIYLEEVYNFGSDESPDYEFVKRLLEKDWKNE